MNGIAISFITCKPKSVNLGFGQSPIHKGDFTVIMGSSGSVKSTLLYALSGMDKPTLGKLYFGGEDISGYSNDELAVFRRKHCGFGGVSHHCLQVAYLRWFFF